MSQNKFNLIKELLKSSTTVFSFKELLLLSGGMDPSLLKSQLHYYIIKGELYKLRRGLYAKNKDYNRFEVATKIYIPSYISFETVLSRSGIIFQYYNQIFVATYASKTIECDGQVYTLRTIKDTILTDNKGIILEESYSIASCERALLDTLYLNHEYHFDNLRPINWATLYDLLPLYNNKRMLKKINSYYNAFKAS